MKTKLKLNDMCFWGDKSSSRYHESQYIEWDRTPGPSEVVFFTDMCLNMASMGCYADSFKIAWLIEPPVTSNGTYEYVSRNAGMYDMILTHNKEFLSVGAMCKYYPFGGCWVSKEDFGKSDPDIMVTMVASDKNYAPGHRLRHEIAAKIKDKVDLCGKGYRPFEEKSDVLGRSYFSIAIENCRLEGYFTEKLIDCFITKTVPIYWGAPDIGQFFNTDGMIITESISDVVHAVENCSKNRYKNMQNAIEENYEKAKEYVVAEDWFYKHILEKEKIV